MDEIPEDVLEAADNALNSVRFSSDPYEQVQACARAILAERERCAKVADDMEALSVDSSEWDAGYRCALDAVAAAIRSGVHP